MLRKGIDVGWVLWDKRKSSHVGGTGSWTGKRKPTSYLNHFGEKKRKANQERKKQTRGGKRREDNSYASK